MATNKERQKSFDLKKHLDSEKAGHDLSGTYPRCEFCKYQINTPYAIGCSVDKEREKDNLCAKAYNHMIYMANKK